jgi:glycosyltransferase involved in cell wall biosynthesis
VADIPTGAETTLGVCMLIERCHPYVAGAERQLEARIPLLKQRGVDVTVITRQEPGLSARAVVAGAPVIRLATRGGRIARSAQFTFGAVRALIGLREKAQIVYAYSPFSPATAALLSKALLGRPVVVQLLLGGSHGDLAVLAATRSGPLRQTLLRRGIDRFVALSEELEHELVAVGIAGDRIVRIPNGVDPGYFRPAEPSTRRTLRKRLGLEGRPVALYVGRVVQTKGLGTLLDAWHDVLREQPSALLLIVGEGPLAAELQARDVPNVRLMGLAPDPLPYFQAADCFAFPSLGEGMPSALLQAMAVGLPCVATNIGGISDVLRPSEGWIVPPGNAEALAVALREALGSGRGDPRAAMARERGSPSFSLEHTADRLVELFTALAGPAGRSAR